MHYLAGCTQAEVAAELGVDQATVSRRLRKGIERLRENMKRSGVVISIPLLLLFLKEEAVIAAPPSLMAKLGKIALAYAAQDPTRVAVGSAEIASHTRSGLHAGASLAIWKTMAIGAGAVTLAFLTVWLVFGRDWPSAKPSGNEPVAVLASDLRDQPSASVRPVGDADSSPQNDAVPVAETRMATSVPEARNSGKPTVEQQSADVFSGPPRHDHFAADPSFIQSDRRQLPVKTNAPPVAGSPERITE